MRHLRPATALLAALLWAGPPAWAASSDREAEPADPLFLETVHRGDVLLAGGDDAGAERAYRAALQLAPEGEQRADVLHKLGIALAQQERFADAEPMIDEAEKIARGVRGGKTVLMADVLRAKTVVLYRTGRVEQARAAFREAKAILEASANAWATGADGSSWVHRPSNWTFPEESGPFKRLRRTMLDDTGHNVVVHYRIGPGGWGATLVSVYVAVDRGVPLADEFRATLLEIIREYPDATVLSDAEPTVAGMSGHRIVMDLPPADDGRVRRTSLSAFARGNVMLRLRASYPAREAATRSPQVATLIEAILAGAAPR